MDVTITLKASGSEAGPFSIFQDSDDFTTALATGVSVASLSAGYLVNADISTRFVKIVSESTCNAADMVSLRFSGVTPTFVTSTVATFGNNSTALATSAATDNKSGIIVADGFYVYISTDAGDTFTNNAELTNLAGPQRMVTFDPVSEKFYVVGNVDDVWYEVTINGTTVTVTQQTASLPGSQRGSIFFHNGVFYIKDISGIYRSEDLTSFSPVSSGWFTPTSTQFMQARSFTGYEKTIFCGDNRNGLYRSQDDGITWSKLTVRNNPIAVHIDQNGRVFITSNDGSANRIDYSDDLGNSWTLFSGSTNVAQPFDMHKYGNLWFFTKDPGNGSKSLAYKTDIVNASTETLTTANLASQAPNAWSDYSRYSVFSCKDRVFLMGQNGSNTLIIKNEITYN